ncbi:OLC1v1022564C4 [Oldenlandia corymbosa var. corymbosa]|uniref:OLC1v1022564C4 n=1 Tax=Oldenlandia corymbosa var. corymbosa TaxID=529605 RepID=A0AAV1BY36_OLDCO|nr:OLC1v1022564C4 [Oldenlandia corymbosa var. corymbosa]
MQDSSLRSTFADDSEALNQKSLPSVNNQLPRSEHKDAISSTVCSRSSDDGYNWRKYGQKFVKGIEFARSYYRCTSPNCKVKKIFELAPDGRKTEIVYKGSHDHPKPQLRRQFSPSTPVPIPQEKSEKDMASTGQEKKPTINFQPGSAKPNNASIPSPQQVNDNGLDSTMPQKRRVDGDEEDEFSKRSSKDGYKWRKYGQKLVKGHEFRRSYYRCTYPNCMVKKIFERAPDGQITEVVFEGSHDHPKPQAKCQIAPGTPVSIQEEKSDKDLAATGQENKPNINFQSGIAEPSNAPVPSPGQEGDDGLEATMPQKHYVNVDDDDPFSKRSSDDGYNWRKYGQKLVKGHEFPRRYYRCTHPNCMVKKIFECAPEGQMTEIVYKGSHDHPMPQPKCQFIPGTPVSIQEEKSDKDLASTGQENKPNINFRAGSATCNVPVPSSQRETDDGLDGTMPRKRFINGEVDEDDPFSKSASDRSSDDGYNWRKYGQKLVKGHEFPRRYYRCTYPNCMVKKMFESAPGGQIIETVYKGSHDHPKPQVKGQFASGTPVFVRQEKSDKDLASNVQENKPNINCQPGCAEPSNAPDPSPQQESEDGLYGTMLQKHCVNGDVDEDDSFSKRRKLDATLEVTPLVKHICKPVVAKTLSGVDILDDGYCWRKYGQKLLQGNPNPRSYYKCTQAECPVRKHVERASHDPKTVITTFEGTHNHDVPMASTGSHETVGSTTMMSGMSRVRPEENGPISLDLRVGRSSSSTHHGSEGELQMLNPYHVQCHIPHNASTRAGVHTAPLPASYSVGKQSGPMTHGIHEKFISAQQERDANSKQPAPETFTGRNLIVDVVDYEGYANIPIEVICEKNIGSNCRWLEFS